MKKTISVFIALALISALFCGCNGEKAPNEDKYTVNKQEDGSITVIDQDGNLLASTQKGDEIEPMDDGSVEIIGDNGAEITIPSDKTNLNQEEIPASEENFSQLSAEEIESAFKDTSSKKGTSSKDDKKDSSKVTSSKQEESPKKPKEVYNITKGGSYTFSSKKTDKMITIDAPKEEVNILFDGAEITNSKGPAMFIRNAAEVNIKLAKNSVNTLADGSNYAIEDDGSLLDGAIFCKADLTIEGEGTLNVLGSYKHGIVSKDDIRISSGKLLVTSKNVAISGKDRIYISGGDITANARTDGIRAQNELEAEKGFIEISGGNIKVNAAYDGIQADSYIKISGGDIKVISGGGSAQKAVDTQSYKGIKAGTDIEISGGSISVDSKDDSLRSMNNTSIKGGALFLSSADEAVNASGELNISGNSALEVKKSGKALKSKNVNISGGKHTLYMNDNAIDGDSIALSGGELTINGNNAEGKNMLRFESISLSGTKLIGLGAYVSKNDLAVASSGAIAMKLSDSFAYPKGSLIILKDASSREIFRLKAAAEFTCILLSDPLIKPDQEYSLSIGSATQPITIPSNGIYAFGKINSK